MVPRLDASIASAFRTSDLDKPNCRAIREGVIPALKAARTAFNCPRVNETGYQAGSLALLMDSVHNLSDEMALVFLYLAFILPLGVSRNLLRSANVFNSVGLIAVSALLLWQVIERVLHPMPIDGAVPIIVGLAAAAANRIVAQLLLKPARKNAAIRLAYIHNMGDVWVSLAPVGAGLLLMLTGYPFFDPLIAAGVAVWFIASTGREIFQSHEELIWPDKIVCGHSDHDDAAVAAN